MCIYVVQLVELSKAQDVEAGDVAMCIYVVQLVELSKAQDVDAGDVVMYIYMFTTSRAV